MKNRSLRRTSGLAALVLAASMGLAACSSDDSDGAQPPEARRIRATCAAVRSGFSRLSATASSSTCVSILAPGCRVDGTSASNPPAR